jgi:hypothetical protein
VGSRPTDDPPPRRDIAELVPRPPRLSMCSGDRSVEASGASSVRSVAPLRRRPGQSRAQRREQHSRSGTLCHRTRTLSGTTVIDFQLMQIHARAEALVADRHPVQLVSLGLAITGPCDRRWLTCPRPYMTNGPRGTLLAWSGCHRPALRHPFSSSGSYRRLMSP